MLSRLPFILLAVAVVSIALTDTGLAQERRRVAIISYFSGQAKVREKEATGIFVQMQDTWINKAIYKGDEIVTGEDSSVVVMIESTRVELFDNTHVEFDITDEGIYVVNMTKGNVTADIKTLVFQLRMINQENVNKVSGEGSTVNVKFESNTDMVITSEAGTAYVTNEYGPALELYPNQSVTIIYDRLKREYIFHPGIGNYMTLSLLPKDADKFKPLLPREKEYVISSDGTGVLRELRRRPGSEPPPKKPPRREFAVNALIRYDWFEYYQDIWYYQGGREGFDTTRARLSIDTKYEFAQLYLGVDAAKPDALEDLWLALFIPEHENVIRLKVGQCRLPFGIQAQQYPEELDLLEYSQGITYAFACPNGDPDQFVPDLDYLFDAGAQLCGEFEIVAKVKLQYNAGFFNGEKRSTPDLNVRKTIVSRLGLNFNDTLTLGTSTYSGKIGSDLDRLSRRRNIDFRIDAGEFTLQGEYIWAEDSPTGDNKEYVTEGYYVEMKFGLKLLRETWKKWRLVARWDMLDPPRDMVDSGARNRHPKSTMASVGLVWQISDRVKFTALFQALSQGKDRYLDTGKPEKSDANQRAILQFNISF